MIPEYALMKIYAGPHGCEVPDFLTRAAETALMQRLGHIGMNCGCEYTSFPRFAGGKQYSRLLHSLGVGMIVWKHTGDPAQAMAGLLHDVATPVFAHVIDFMKGDYLTQEATEDGTLEMIAQSPEMQDVLHEFGLKTEQVSDYHLYPVADNDSPRLCADRLEYTLGNLYFYGFASLGEIEAIYADIQVERTEDGREELVFSDADCAETFGFLSLKCSKVYVSDEDRYSMQMLSEIVAKAVRSGMLSEKELHGTEERITALLTSSAETAAQWKWFCGLNRMERAEVQGQGEHWRNIQAKKRCIDPYIRGYGRLSDIRRQYAEALETFRKDPQDAWLRGYREEV